MNRVRPTLQMPTDLDAGRTGRGADGRFRAAWAGVVGLVLLAMSGCSTLNSYGIGGPPKLMCSAGLAEIDDRIAGSDAVRLSVVRRFADGDKLCPK